MLRHPSPAVVGLNPRCPQGLPDYPRPRGLYSAAPIVQCHHHKGPLGVCGLHEFCSYTLLPPAPPVPPPFPPAVTRMSAISFAVATCLFLPWLLVYAIAGESILSSKVYRALDAAALDLSEYGLGIIDPNR